MYFSFYGTVTTVALTHDIISELFCSSDCNRTCVKGKLNSECNACSCDGHVLTGRVLGESNVPLAETNISLVEAPYRVLAQTNISGFFTAFNVCADTKQELLITKEGFVPFKKNATLLTPTTSYVITQLEFAGKLVHFFFS